jgi:hypothetical protein
MLESHLKVESINYHGWQGSYLLKNGLVEVVVVPANSRVMQFRFAGSEQGAFWENRALDGMPGQREGRWRNFGGDKAWPAPQGNWDRITGRAWPPPATFDSAGSEPRIDEQGLLLASPVDEQYGLQICRHITLKPGLPVMEIASWFRKVADPPLAVGSWVITQLRDPQRVFALLPESSNADSAYRQLTGPAPLDVHSDGRLLSFVRHPAHNLKIAMNSNSLAWMDDEYVLRIDASADPSSNNACTTSVYTNMDPLQYVELESEGPVTDLAPGDVLELTTTYTLTRRSTADMTAEARRAFGLPSHS